MRPAISKAEKVKAVRATGDEAIDGLLSWIDKIRSNGGNISVKQREHDPQLGLLSVALYGMTTATITFPTREETT